MNPLQSRLAGLRRRLRLVTLARGVSLLCLVLLGSALLVPLRQRTDDLALALRVEREYPVLNDALASTVQFLRQPEDSPAAGSPSLRREAIQRALRLAQGCD